jgi:hypothetical protein
MIVTIGFLVQHQKIYSANSVMTQFRKIPEPYIAQAVSLKV